MYSNALEYILRLKSTLRSTDNTFYTQTHIESVKYGNTYRRCGCVNTEAHRQIHQFIILLLALALLFYKKCHLIN